MDESNDTLTAADLASATEAQPTTPEVSESTWPENMRQVNELSRTRPLPIWESQMVDLRWYDAHRDDPEIQAYRGDYVAIFEEKLIGGGPEYLALQLKCAKLFGFHPCRPFIAWVDDGRDFHVTLLD